MELTLKAFETELLEYAQDIAYYFDDEGDLAVYPPIELQLILRDIPTYELLDIEQAELTYTEYQFLKRDLASLKNCISSALKLCNNTTIMVYTIAYMESVLDNQYATQRLNTLAKYLCRRDEA